MGPAEPEGQSSSRLRHGKTMSGINHMSEAKTSKELRQFPSGVANNSSTDESIKTNPTELIVLAQQAIEQKRFKQCMLLVKSILNAEPENKEALALRSWMRSYLEQDLAKARAMVEEARSKNQRRLFARAEIMLHTILEVDPENDDAKKLLSLSALPEAPALPTSNKVPLADRIPVVVQRRAPIAWLVACLIVLGVGGTLWFATSKAGGNQPPPSKSEEVRSTERSAESVATKAPLSGSLALLVVPGTGVQLSVNDGPLGAVPDSLELKAGDHRLRFVADGYLPQTISERVVGGERRTVAVLLKPVGSADAPARENVRPAVPQRTSPQSTQAKTLNAAVAPRATDRTAVVANPPETSKPSAPAITTGILALNAQVPVDVYMADKYLGSTPLSLSLPAGLQTLEFRYQEIRKMVSFMVKSAETRREMVTFEVTVPINARPWAEVSVEGIQPRTLGQTPLGGVTLAVGSVLVFKNPNLPEKRYRVTGKEASIQVELQ
jgi:hypothetical protein